MPLLVECPRLGICRHVRVWPRLRRRLARSISAPSRPSPRRPARRYRVLALPFSCWGEPSSLGVERVVVRLQIGRQGGYRCVEIDI